MKLTQLARISILCFLVAITALAPFAEAAPKCGCTYCQQDPSRACNLDGQQTTCSYFLSVALCPAGATASTDSTSSVDASFLALTSENVQEPAACMNLVN